MGCTSDWEVCPKCGKVTFATDYYYRTSEEYGFCTTCGYTRNSFIKRDEERKMIRELTASYDLKTEKVVFAIAHKTNEGFEIFNFTPVLPSDTETEIEQFLNLHLCFEPYTNGASGRELPARFNMFKDNSKDGQSFILLEKDGKYEQIWYLNIILKINDGILEVHEPVRVNEEYGGYGVIWKKDEHGVSVFALKEGAVPEITDDVSFATTLVDGKLTVLKGEFKESEEGDE